MTESDTNLGNRVEQLLRENQQLKKTCKNLEESLQVLEKMVADNNQRQLRVEVENMELNQIFSAATDAMWVIRDDGIVIRANEAMLALLAKREDQVIGHNCKDLLDSEHCHNPSCPLTTINDRQLCEYDIEFSNNGNNPQSYILTAAPLTTIVGTTAIISQFKNITERKIAEQKLEELNRTLTQMARVDGLTQIANRRHFDETIQQEWSRLRRDKKPLSLLLADIDYFKKYNDCYGHQAGDQCLIKVGATLKETIKRPADLAARYGGEEFVILLPDVALAGAKQVGRKIIQAVAELAIEHQASEVSSFVTLSIGAACMLPDGEQTTADLIAQADARLYQAKEQGRNRLVWTDQ